MNDELVELVEEHLALAMFTQINAESDKENQLLPSYSPLTPILNHPLAPPSPLRSWPNSPLTPLAPLTYHGQSENSEFNNIPEGDVIEPPQMKSNHQAAAMKRKASQKNEPLSSPSGLPYDLPFPGRFSVPVEEAISQKNVLPVRLKLIKDVGAFYYGICKHPKQGDYGRIARKLCDVFPEMRDVSSEKYWVS